MSPADRAAHWRDYRRMLAVEAALCIGAPLVLHLLLGVTHAA